MIFGHLGGEISSTNRTEPTPGPAGAGATVVVDDITKPTELSAVVRLLEAVLTR